MFAQSIVDSAQVEWIFAHWLDVALVGIGVVLAWRNRSKLGSLLSTVKTSGEDLLDDDADDEASDPRLRLSIALCQLSDHCQGLGNKAGIDACAVLAPIVMQLPPPPDDA